MKSVFSVLAIATLVAGCSTIKKNEPAIEASHQERAKFYNQSRTPSSLESYTTKVGRNSLNSIVNCPSVEDAQARIYSSYYVLVAMDDQASCEEGVKEITSIEKLLEKSQLNKRVRPYEELKIYLSHKGKVETVLTYPFEKLTDALQKERIENSFYYGNSILLTNGSYGNVSKAIEALPYAKSAAGKKYINDKAIYAFAICGSQQEASYIFRQDITAGLVGKDCEVADINQVEIAPLQLKRYFFGLSDLVTNYRGFARTSVAVMLYDHARTPGFQKYSDEMVFYTPNETLNKNSQEFYNTTLNCVKDYLKGRTSWKTSEFAASGCFIIQ